MEDSAIRLFHSLLNEGLQRLCLNISLPSRAYISDLLADFVPSDRLFAKNDLSGQRQLQPLAELYFKAQEASFQEKLEIFKQIGDKSLYLGGFFREFLNRKLETADYYMNMGRQAYGHLANHHPQEEIFREISYCFSDLADVLSYMAQKNSIRTHADLLKVCRNYLETGSKAAFCQLEDHGIPIQKTKSSH